MVAGHLAARNRFSSNSLVKRSGIIPILQKSSGSKVVSPRLFRKSVETPPDLSYFNIIANPRDQLLLKPDGKATHKGKRTKKGVWFGLLPMKSRRRKPLTKHFPM